MRAYTGFTAELSVFCRELTVTRLLIGWKITSPILDRAVSYVDNIVDWTGITSLCLVVVSIIVNYSIHCTYVMCRVEIQVARAVNSVGSCLVCVVCPTRKLRSETFQVKLLRCDKILLVNTFRL